jgi:hypothetical protein
MPGGKRLFRLTLQADFALGIFLGVALLTAPAAMADEAILVLARADAKIEAMTQAEVADLFLGRGSAKGLTPFDREDAALKQRFYRTVADISLNSLRAYWAKQVFTGRGRPPKSLQDQEVEQALSASSSAVTYVLASQPPLGCKVLLKLEASEAP